MMNIKKPLSVLVLLFSFAYLPPAFAEIRACMISGSVEFEGEAFSYRDCMQITDSSLEETLKGHCEALYEMNTAMESDASELEFLAACPEPPQGACENFTGTGFDAYYYDRTADDIAALRQSCNAIGGSWQE